MKFIIQHDGSFVVTFSPDEKKLAIQFLNSLEMPKEEDQEKVDQMVYLLGVDYKTMLQ